MVFQLSGKGSHLLKVLIHEFPQLHHVELVLPEGLLEKGVANDDPPVPCWARLEVVRLYVLPSLLDGLGTGR